MATVTTMSGSVASFFFLFFLVVPTRWTPISVVRVEGKAYDAISGEDEPNIRFRNRNLLDGTTMASYFNGTSNTLGGESWAEYRTRCTQVNVQLHLAIGVHFALYVDPTKDDEENNHLLDQCDPLWLHADSSGPTGKVKGVLPASNKPPPDGFFESRLASMFLGTFPFHRIADAYEAIEVNAPGSKHYHIVSNNCAVLILGMMRELGIELTSEERQQVADGLVAADAYANDKLAEYIRASGQVETTLGLTGHASNSQLLERLTLRQIALALDGPREEATVPKRKRRLDTTNNNNNDNPNHTSRDLIVGGVLAKVQEYPFYVQLGEATADRPSCGAVLVAPDVVLFAAACNDQALFARQVLVGATTYNTETNLSQWRDIVGDILLHPKYGNNNFDYDFALMKIEAVTLPNLIPVKLSTDRQYPAPNQILTTMGFGNVRSSYTIRPNQLLRKVNITTATYTECKKSYSFDKSSGFCAMAKNKGPCRGDFGGPVLNRKGELVALARYRFFLDCSLTELNSYGRLSSGLDWIQDTICSLSAFRGNYTFCPSVSCPPPLNLMGERNNTFPGGAAVPAVTGDMLSPAQVSISSQIPAAGTPIQPGTSRVVQITASDANNVTTACNWTITVPPVTEQSYVEFTAQGGGNVTNEYQVYSLDVPYMGNFLEVWALVDSEVVRAVDAVIDLTFRRVDLLNTSDSTVLQTFTITGDAEIKIYFNVTAEVASPDPSSYGYFAYFRSTGITVGGIITYKLIGQVKKM